MRKPFFTLILAVVVSMALLPTTVKASPVAPPPAGPAYSQTTADELVFLALCSRCHGADALGRGFAPNIRGRTVANINDALALIPQMANVHPTPEEILHIASFLETLAKPLAGMIQPAGGRFTPGATNTVQIGVTGTHATITRAEFQVLFNDLPGTLSASAIIAQVPIAVPAPLAGAAAVADTVPAPTNAPAGSTLSVVVTGIVTAFDPATGEWQIGTPPMPVYESADTSQSGNRPGVGEPVRVEVLRTLAPGPLVAATISPVIGELVPAGAAKRESSLLFNGTVQSTVPAVQAAGFRLEGPKWVVGGLEFLIDDGKSQAAIGVGLATGSAVTVRFTIQAAGNGNAATQIISPQLSDVIARPLHTAPADNTEIIPATVPAKAIALFTIDGIVAAVNPDGEWLVGNPPVTVYQSATTTISAPEPLVGDRVSVSGRRTTIAGPILADSITLTAAGPLVAGAPSIDLTFLFNGTVDAVSPSAWTVGGASFKVNDPEAPAVISPGLAAGSAVTVLFKADLPPKPDESLWAPLNLPFNFNAPTNTGAASLTIPAVSVPRTGFIMMRMTDGLLRVNTLALPVTLDNAPPPPPLPPPPPPPAPPPTTAPAFGGGFGSGGGGFSGSNTLLGSGLLGNGPAMDGTGKTLSAGELKTGDSKCALAIPANTLIRNAAGTAVFGVSAALLDTPPAAPVGGAILRAYELGPTGVVFAPAITLTLSYTDDQIPAGMPENWFYIATWDGAKWIKLTSTVDAANNKVTAQVEHFSSFALLAQPPPPTTQPPPSATTIPPTTVPPTTLLPTTILPPTTQPVTTAPTQPPIIVPSITPNPGPGTLPISGWLIVGLTVATLAIIVAVLLMTRKKGSGPT